MFKTVTRFLFGVLFIGAGANHFINPDFYLRMMPAYLPWHSALVAISGVAEIALGAMLLVPRFQVIAAWGLGTRTPVAAGRVDRAAGDTVRQRFAEARRQAYPLS